MAVPVAITGGAVDRAGRLEVQRAAGDRRREAARVWAASGCVDCSDVRTGILASGRA